MQTKQPFSERVLALVAKIPRGKVTTYKDIAHALGTGAYRGVGQALRCNKNAPVIPCHRVVASDGRLGGYFGETAGEAIAHKAALLAREGIAVKDGRVVDFQRRRYTF